MATILPASPAKNLLVIGYQEFMLSAGFAFLCFVVYQ